MNFKTTNLIKLSFVEYSLKKKKKKIFLTLVQLSLLIDWCNIALEK